MQVDRHARLLATESKCSLLSVEYRLAPEHPYPAGLNDCIEVFRQLHHVRASYPGTQGPTAVAGDSAGANLALAPLHDLGRKAYCSHSVQEQAGLNSQRPAILSLLQ
ncbi:alpha/beta hydrolase fold domain-containing protein [Granulosicoccus antarcticus]|uniref:Carboxylesterase NlhH n=1 Tax=Granulosicoccus antarcticus IMCC3135 TaxID=1192854 RepID=A0A2Z2P3E5_9GAMM|nr:Carboxylesterase NlhH [Granulosicoccus antarcticus IMCC3135]